MTRVNTTNAECGCPKIFWDMGRDYPDPKEKKECKKM